EVERVKNPDNVLLVVLGATDWLEKRFAPRALREFVHSGGAMLLASDRQTRPHGIVEADLHTRISGDCLVVPGGSRSAYRGLSECPIIQDFADHPIFRDISAIATNRPGHLIRPTNPLLSLLAWFPSDAKWEFAGRFGMERAPAMRSWPFAAGGELRKGKAL